MNAAARAVAVLTTATVFVLASASVALADAPTTWADGPDRSALQWIILFVGGPLALGLIITLFALLTARNNYTPPPPSTDVEKAPAHH